MRNKSYVHTEEHVCIRDESLALVACISECGCYVIDVWTGLVAMSMVVQVFGDGCIWVVV